MPWKTQQSSRLRRLFLEGFSAMDVAEPLVSFDDSARAENVQPFMQDKGFNLVGVRQNGLVEGYVRREDLASATCGEHFHPFTPDDDLVPDTANLIDVVKSLGHKSRRETRNAIKEFETLRNNLAHTQEIIPSGWQRIVIACSRWENNLGKTADHYGLKQKKN